MRMEPDDENDGALDAQVDRQPYERDSDQAQCSLLAIGIDPCQLPQDDGRCSYLDQAVETEAGQGGRLGLDCGIGEHEDTDHIPNERRRFKLATTMQELMSGSTLSDLNHGASVSDLVRSAQGQHPQSSSHRQGYRNQTQARGLGYRRCSPG